MSDTPALKSVYLSVVIPVYNEELGLRKLANRLFPALEKLGKTYEVIFTNDGSKDDSWGVLQALQAEHPQHITIIDFNANYGQHMAIMAAFERSKGEVVINMDADLQNPPEEIEKLLQKVDEGYDVVGSYRANRFENDHFMRRFCSKIMNRFREWATGVKIKDQGCMFRAYTRRVIDLVCQSESSSTFITVLAQKFANNPTEIAVQHEARAAGTSNYSVYELIRVTLDLFTNFSLIPLQLFSLGGIAISFLSFLLCGYLMIRRLIIGPEAEGIFTLFAILFFFIGICITGIGIVGEYVGRTYQAVSRQPRFLVRKVMERKD